MKTIYLDTEFSEGFFKPITWLPKWFPGNKPRWSIELISIGLVDDQGKEYYAINKDFKRSRCNDWVKQNVLTKLPSRVIQDEDSWWYRNYGYDCEEVLEPNPVYKSIQCIKNDIINFVAPIDDVYAFCELHQDQQACLKNYLERNPIEFKAYYADYDWVLFCTIFGTMMDLPDGFPMYVIDIKQEMDKKVLEVYPGETHNHSALIPDTFDLKLKWFKGITGYPKQSDTDSHSAVADARFNKQLDEFILTL